MCVVVDGIRRLAAVVLAADVRGLLDESPDLARIRLDILGSGKHISLLRIGKQRMRVCHYHIVACDAYNAYMPRHFELACWASRSTSPRQSSAGLCDKRWTQLAILCRYMIDSSVSMLFKEAESNREGLDGASIGTRRVVSGMPRHSKLWSMEQGWGGAMTKDMFLCLEIGSTVDDIPSITSD